VRGATATPAELWPVGFRVRAVEQAPDGALWLIEDDREGGLYRLAPK
jgi:glucose/arabinose dehydrogenase